MKTTPGMVPRELRVPGIESFKFSGIVLLHGWGKSPRRLTSCP